MLVFVHTQLDEPEGSTPRRLGLSMKEKHLDFFLSGWKHVAVKRGSFDLSMFLDVVRRWFIRVRVEMEKWDWNHFSRFVFLSCLLSQPVNIFIIIIILLCCFFYLCPYDRGINWSRGDEPPLLFGGS